MTPLPSLEELLIPLFCRDRIQQNICDGLWSKDGARSFYFSKSCFALKVILEVYKKETKKNELTLWVPDYICNEAISQIRNSAVRIVFYPIDERLNIRKESIDILAREHFPDFVLLVHFFGCENNDEALLSFCAANNVEIIEDAAHVLYPTGGIGTKGTFTFFSPHKHLPIMQGSVLVVRLNNSFSAKSFEILTLEIENLIQKLGDGQKEQKPYTWIMKKIIQKILPQICGVVYRLKKHGIEKDETHFVPLSKYAYNEMRRYDLFKLEQIATIKNHNYNKIVSIISASFDAQPIFKPSNTDVPSVAHLVFANEKERSKAEKYVNVNGIFCTDWPTLSPEISKHSYPWKLFNTSLSFAIHYQLQLSIIEKNLKKYYKNEIG